MRRRWGLAVAAIALFGALWTVAARPADAPSTDGEDASRPDATPHASGLVERAGARLAQIDVTVVGPDEAIAALTRDDFIVKINRTRITDFRLDRLCGPPEGLDTTRSTPSAATATSAQAPDTTGTVAGRRPASYLLYFDQTQLTSQGRRRSLELAREMIPGILVASDDRVMIVSNAGRLEIVQALTADVAALESALDRLENDRTQWDEFPSLEERRVADVLRVLNEEDLVQMAAAEARGYEREERLRTERSVRRLTATLGQLVDIEPPKAVIYFADTLRSNPGEHYLSFFGSSHIERDSTLGLMQSSAFTVGAVFDRLINTAASQSIRFYTVQAEGLGSYLDPIRPTSRAQSIARTGSGTSRIRQHHAQETLSSMASETGGRAFLNGIDAQHMVERIDQDASCLFLISFDPQGFREDSALRVKVEVASPRVELRVRGRIVVPSEESRRTARLLRAFSAPDSIADPFDVRALVVPTGFGDGQFTALLQVVVPAVPLQGATWDVGATIVRDDRVRHEGSGRVSLSGPDVPVIYESEVRIEPGSQDIVAVAHESNSGLIASTESRVEWPEPPREGGFAGPVAVMQPASGAFLRNDAVRSMGPLTRAAGEMLDGGLPTALLTLVCRPRHGGGTDVRAERTLTGESEVTFPSQHIAPDGQRCAQLRDVVPARSLGPGVYRYKLRLLDGERVIDERTVDLAVRAADP